MEGDGPRGGDVEGVDLGICGNADRDVGRRSRRRGQARAFGAEPPESLLESAEVARSALRVLVSSQTGHVVDVRRADPLTSHELSAEAADEGNRTPDDATSGAGS